MNKRINMADWEVQLPMQRMKEWHKSLRAGDSVLVEVTPESAWYASLPAYNKFLTIRVENIYYDTRYNTLTLYSRFAHPYNGEEFFISPTICINQKFFDRTNKLWRGYILYRKAPAHAPESMK